MYKKTTRRLQNDGGKEILEDYPTFAAYAAGVKVRFFQIFFIYSHTF